MTGRLLEVLGNRAGAGDLVATADDTLTAGWDGDGGYQLSHDETAQVQIRVIDQGRIGWAGGEAQFESEVLDAAIRSAAVGGPAPIYLPAAAPLPTIASASSASSRLGARDLLDLVAALRSRVDLPRTTLGVTAERSFGSVRVGNTRGVWVEYQTSMVGLGAALWIDDGPGDPVLVHACQSAPIDEVQIEALATELEQSARPRLLDHERPARSTRVWFAPRAVRALLAPLMARLIGESWLHQSEPVPQLDQRLTLTDDPWAPGRPGSRPIDDDGVATTPIVLIEKGTAKRGIVDLIVGAGGGVPSTGHAWRRGFAPPRIGFSNVVLAGGDASEAGLFRAANEGILVRSLRFGPAPNPLTGVFRVAVPWAYRVRGGEVVGRLEGAVLSGNVFDLLTRVVAIGADHQWIGAAAIPSLVLDGASLTFR